MNAMANPGFPVDWEQKGASWIEVSDYSGQGWQTSAVRTRALHHCRQLEQGEILFFRRPPFALSSDDCDYLMRQRASGSRLHKNISYRPAAGLLRGFSGPPQDRQRMQKILWNYSAQATRLLTRFLTPYAGTFVHDYASFRPLEEEGRRLPLHKRNDLLHVDAFPSRPTHGGRILRVFTNIHPFRGRVWKTAGSFAALADLYAADAGLHHIKNPGVMHRFTRWLRSAGLPVHERTPYDRFMLRFHDFLKENSQYQSSAHARLVEFPPMSTWLVLTDGVPHAVLSGQFALEQTFILPMQAQVAPQHSPLRILETIAGQALV